MKFRVGFLLGCVWGVCVGGGCGVGVCGVCIGVCGGLGFVGCVWGMGVGVCVCVFSE